MRRRIEKITSGILLVEHTRMEMAKIFQEVDRLKGSRAGMEGEGHLVSQSALGIAFRAAKRSFDITASAVGMVVLSPLLLVTAIAVKATSPGPVIFKQKRYGKDKIPFTCYKFRTMKIDTPPNIPTRVMREDKAVMTPIGAMLRKTSIDELPQLVNIVKGDIPLRILKTRPEFSEESMGAFALPAKSSTNKEQVFSQVVSCFASGLRMRRISGFDCNCIGGMGTQFLAKPVFGVSPVRSGALFQKSNNRLAKAAW